MPGPNGFTAMNTGAEISGGSAANTWPVLPRSAAREHISVRSVTTSSAVFSQDLKAVGVDYPMRAATEGPSTARCLIFVTPDADRTMQTYLGVSVMLS